MGILATRIRSVLFIIVSVLLGMWAVLLIWDILFGVVLVEDYFSGFLAWAAILAFIRSQVCDRNKETSNKPMDENGEQAPRVRK